MSGPSSIEWTDATWNPVRGCSRVSEGCRNCYAERVAARFSTHSHQDGDTPGGVFAGFAETTPHGPRWTGKVALVPGALDWPLRRRKPLRIFVNSMSDLFHESLSDHAIAAVFGVMLLAEQHTFQVLTKRPERMRRWFEWIASNPVRIGETAKTATRFIGGPAATCMALLGAHVTEKTWRGPLFTAAITGGIEPAPDAPIRKRWPLPNVWLGVSVEDQATADQRIPLLLQTPAAHRFISAEPLLGPVYIGTWLRPRSIRGLLADPPEDHPEHHILDWVIAGGESGPGARPCDIAWIRSIIADCRAAGVPCFVKQLGADIRASVGELNGWPIHEVQGLTSDTSIYPPRVNVHSRKGNDPAEWPKRLRVRELPRC